MYLKLLILLLYVFKSDAFPGWGGGNFPTGKATVQMRLPVNKAKLQTYDPSRVDWNGVISGCRAACRFEKRLCNFYIRAAAHDALAVSEKYGGADGSLILTDDELRRPENNYDNFAYIISKNALALAKKYDASVADIVAVCGAVASEYLGGPKIVQYDARTPFLVGRFDRIEPNPRNALAPGNINTEMFANFAKSRGLSVKELTALMGSHSVMDTKGCLRGKILCDPNVEECDNTDMFTWSNIYFKELCSQITEIYQPPKEVTPIPFDPNFYLNQAQCKFTSQHFRQKTVDRFELDVVDIIADNELLSVKLVNDPINNQTIWMYTVHDAWMGKACQKALANTKYNNDIRKAMLRFKDSVTEWNQEYTKAYKKMVSIGVQWSIKKGYPITGYECKSGYKSIITKEKCNMCNIDYANIKKYKCPKSCVCSTAFSETATFYEQL